MKQSELIPDRTALCGFNSSVNGIDESAIQRDAKCECLSDDRIILHALRIRTRADFIGTFENGLTEK